MPIALYSKKSGGMIRPFYAKFKKHKCFICDTPLKLTKITHYHIVKGTLEAANKSIQFDIFNHPVDYTFWVFKCEKCGNIVSIDDQYFLEYPEQLEPYTSNFGHYSLKDDYYIYLQSLDQKDGSSLYQQHLDSIQKQKPSSKKNWYFF